MAERKTERVNVWLTPEQVAWLKTKKNLSENVRAMVTEAMNLERLAQSVKARKKTAGKNENALGKRRTPGSPGKNSRSSR
jgi:hypothetical protein